MGGALLDGWLKSGLSRDAVMIVDPVMTEAGTAPAGIACVAQVGDLPDCAPAMVMLAVKPQIMETVAAGYIDLGQSLGRRCYLHRCGRWYGIL